MVQFDISLDALHFHGIFPVGYLRLLLKNFLNTPDRGRSLGKHVDGIPTGQHRPDKHIDILIKCNETPQGNVSYQCQIAAVNKGNQAGQPNHHIQQRHHDGLQTDNMQIFFHAVPVGLGKSPHFCPFPDKSLDDPDTGKAFLHKIRKIGNRFLPFQEPFMYDFPIINFPRTNQEHRNDCQQGQLEIHIVHHLADYHDSHDRSVKDTDNRRADRHAHCIQVTGETGHQIAGLMLVIIFHAHFFQMPEHIIAQLLLYGTGRAKQKVPP